MSVTYTDAIESLTDVRLSGFFVGWPDHPSPATHLAILRGSQAVWLALDGDRCVGFINALSDGVFYAYIPLLEVLPEYQHLGIGTELVHRMTATLSDMYAIDVVCDESVVPFYAGKGFGRCAGMVKRNFANQRGAVGRMQPDPLGSRDAGD